MVDASAPRGISNSAGLDAERIVQCGLPSNALRGDSGCTPERLRAPCSGQPTTYSKASRVEPDLVPRVTFRRAYPVTSPSAVPADATRRDVHVLKWPRCPMTPRRGTTVAMTSYSLHWSLVTDPPEMIPTHSLDPCSLSSRIIRPLIMVSRMCGMTSFRSFFTSVSRLWFLRTFCKISPRKIASIWLKVIDLKYKMI